MANCELNIDIRGFIKSKITGNSHTYETALNEFIHNSISAEANNIFILHNHYNNPIIVDDGTGMDKQNMDKLKKFYDSSKRVEGTIGTYNIGLKEAMLKFGGKWIILSKKKKTDDIVYCEFNADNLEKFAYGGEFIDCIDSGFTNKTRETIFINILDELGLINKNKSISLKNFSGTVIYQQEYNSDKLSNKFDNTDNNDLYENNEENMHTYITLYKNLKLKLSQYNCNFIYGSYIYKENNVIIDTSLLTTIDKLDWLCWNNNSNSIMFDIVVYKTAKNILFAIEYENIIYKFNKSKHIFDKLKSINIVGRINVKINILNNTQYTTQDIYYKDLKYKSSINGIMLNRNGLDLYDFPNKYDNVFLKDTTTRKYARIFVSFIGNDILDTIFNILPNKSLFLPNNLNIKLKNILEIIKNNVYEYLDLKLLDILSIKDAFSYILQNIELENIRNKIKKIQDNYTNIVSKLIINNNYRNLIYINKYVLCKKILYYYKNIYLYQLQNTLNEFKINYKNICKKLKLCLVISKIFNNKNIYKTYFDIIKRCTFIEKSIKINETKNKKNINVLNIHFSFKFNSIYKNIRFQILYNQLMLSKYKLLINKYNNLIII